MSPAALRRHITKLTARGFLLLEEDGYTLTSPHDALSHTLLDLACKEPVEDATP